VLACGCSPFLSDSMELAWATITTSWVTATSSIMSSMTTVTSTTIDPFMSFSYTLTTAIPCKLSPFFPCKCTSLVWDIHTINHCTVTTSASTTSIRTTATMAPDLPWPQKHLQPLPHLLPLPPWPYIANCTFFTYNSPTELCHVSETLVPRSSYMHKLLSHDLHIWRLSNC
jgi:hypothetical protein